MPTVALDCRFGSALAGLGTFTRSLTAALLRLDNPWKYVLFVRSKNEKWLGALDGRSPVTMIEADFDHYSLEEQASFPNLIQDAECDLFFSPHFNVPFLCPVPFVCTVHDLILHRFPNEAPLARRVAYRFLLGKSVRAAAAVLTVSEGTKEDLRANYGETVGSKTVVAYPGVESVFRHRTQEQQEEVKRRHGLDAPYFLYVGNCKEHKNVAGLIAAFVSAALPGMELVIVAGGRECAHLGRTAGVRFVSQIPPEDLPALYSGAFAFVTATHMEGFCLPVIEAMACRCPVLATNVQPLPEISGGHALLVDPRTQALTDGMRRLVQDPERRSSAVLHAAEAFSHVYSWDHTAEVTAGVLAQRLEHL